MEQYILYNGNMLPAASPIIGADNRGFRYGDGLFETMKVVKGSIPLAELHFDRLWKGLQLLQFNLPQTFDAGTLQNQILNLCRRNKVEHLARVRLNVFRGDGSLDDTSNLDPNVIIQCSPLRDSNKNFDDTGLTVDIYPDAYKSCDAFANLKSNNFLYYTMAALYARQNNIDDALVLNQHKRICDSSIANVFWVKNKTIFTPLLSEGCVAGVMRRYLLNNIFKEGHVIKESTLTVEYLREVDEIFLTNAVQGIRWVKRIRDKSYSNTISSRLHNHLLHDF